MSTLDADDILAIRAEIDDALSEIKGGDWIPSNNLQQIYTIVEVIDGFLNSLGSVVALDATVAKESTVDSILTTIGSGSVAGPGATPRTITVTAGGNPVVGVGVWITTDQEGANVVGGTVYTNDAGEVVLLVDSGTTYYVWCDSDDAEISNPTEWEA